MQAAKFGFREILKQKVKDKKERREFNLDILFAHPVKIINASEWLELVHSNFYARRVE